MTQNTDRCLLYKCVSILKINGAIDPGPTAPVLAVPS